MRPIVAPDAAGFLHVQHPHDVRIQRARCHRGFTTQREMLALILTAIVAIRHAMHIQADNLAPIRHQVSAIPFHCRLG